MEEIKVGEYTRNEDGYIEKIDSYDKLTNIYKDEEGILRKWEGEDVYGNEYSSIIVKHSTNLIDLIQCGDYVNGKLIHKIDIRKNSSYIYYGNGKTFTDYQIETVVTKEQFQSVEYRLEE